MNARPVVLYIACSIDGYIAGPNGELDFLSQVEKQGEDYGYQEFVNSVDTVIMGRKTYDKVLSFGIPFPHADKTCYIVTRSAKPSKDSVHFYTGNLKTLVTDLKSKEGKTIFIDGGAELVALLLEENLVDDIIVSIIPSILGDGIRLFKTQNTASSWELVSAKTFDTGLVQLHYRKT